MSFYGKALPGSLLVKQQLLLAHCQDSEPVAAGGRLNTLVQAEDGFSTPLLY